MSNDNKTLADVQPGGRVRLGDAPWPEIDAILADAYSAGAEGLPFEGIARRAAVRAAVAALSAQPTPGGQGDARTQWLEVRGLAAGIVKNLQAFADSPHKGAWCGALDDALSFADQIEKDAAAAYESILAARQPVGEPVALVVPGAPTRCRHCESTDLEWFAHVRAVNDVPHGRLTTHDVGCVFVLGCNECSETLHTVKADSIAALLAAPPAQAVDLGQFRDLVTTLVDRCGDDLSADQFVLAGRLLNLIDSQAVGNG